MFFPQMSRLMDENKAQWRKLGKLKSVRSRQTLHPISRLQQIMQAKQKESPSYTCEESKQENKQTVFLVTCTLYDGSVASAEHTSKKRAKTLATEKILESIGATGVAVMSSEKTAIQPCISNNKPLTKSTSTTRTNASNAKDPLDKNKTRKVTFMQNCNTVDKITLIVDKNHHW